MNDKIIFKKVIPEGSNYVAGASDCAIRAFSSLFNTGFTYMRNEFKKALPNAEHFNNKLVGFTGDQIVEVLAAKQVKYDVLYPKNDKLLVRQMLELDKEMLVSCSNNSVTHLTCVKNGVMHDSSDEFLDYFVEYVIVMNPELPLQWKDIGEKFNELSVTYTNCRSILYVAM